MIVVLLSFAACGSINRVACAQADDVASYLEQHGLTQLLAVHLENQLEGLANEQREAAIRRLADLYAQLLEREVDPARRIALEERSRQLLAQAPARSADDLRLALLRASYRSAEKVAENHRLRLARPEEVETARRTFSEIAPQLQALSEQLRETIATLERRLSRAGGADAVSLGETADRARASYAQCMFLTAWSLYYQDWLTDDKVIATARQAEPLFAEIMGAENATPSPEDVSIDLRSDEAVARSILGMALCKSITASSATAVSWIALLASPNAYEPLRTQASVWMMAIHLEHHEYREAINDLDEARANVQEVPLAWLRLCAVYALEDARRDRFGDDLIKFAVTELAARGELQQVLDLASRFGVEALGDSGFALKYVQGVIAYQDARKRHGLEEPTIDPTIIAMYRFASDALKAAAAEPDAEKYPLAAAACRRLVAWCSYFQSNFLDAQREFEAASSVMTGAEAAEALWMAIVSLDKVVEAGRSPEAELALNGLVDRYITQYPSDPNTAKLLLKRSLREKTPSPDAVAELLAIPPDNDAYATAQMRAADMLYQLFREAGDNDRAVYAGQFLSVAIPLISQPPASGSSETSAQRDASLQRFIVRCRQALEVSLTEGVERLVAARAAFEALDAVAASDPAAVAVHRDEIDCRRAQERLLAGEPAAAAELTDSLWERDNQSIWARLAVRSMFKHAHQVWKSGEIDESERQAAIERVVRYGGRVLHEFKDDPRAFDRPGAMGYVAAVAEATMALWERTREPARAEAALFLYETLLGRRPSSATFLRSAAILASACDQPQKSLDHWRRLVAGTQVGTPEWFEAKFHQIELLAKLDPPRAREVMNQHKQLNPDYGPDPWGAQLKGLDEQIPANPAASTSTAPAHGSDAGGDGAGGSP